jgi:hypothetical protein
MDVDRLTAAWLNLWGGSPDTDIDDATVWLARELMLRLAVEYLELSGER